jgi:hypothetical protein
LRASVVAIAAPDDYADVEVLRALRATPGQDIAGLAAVLALPRSNFGRRLDGDLLARVSGLVERRLIETDGSRYRLSERGRGLLAERAFGATL